MFLPIAGRKGDPAAVCQTSTSLESIGSKSKRDEGRKLMLLSRYACRELGVIGAGRSGGDGLNFLLSRDEELLFFCFCGCCFFLKPPKLPWR